MSARNLGKEFVQPGADLGGLTPEEVLRRGKKSQRISHNDVERALHRVQNAQVIELLEEWRDDDRETYALGGRPTLISDSAVLTGLLLLAGEATDLLLTNLSDLFHMRLGKKSRALLGLEPSMTTFIGEVKETKRWYANTERAFHRAVDLMDPFPQERRRAKSFEEIAAILDSHDRELERERRQRLNEFTNRFIAMTYRAQPRIIRRITRKMDISFDQTYMETPNKKGFSRKHLRQKVREEKRVGTLVLPPGPVDAFAGWHIRSGERTDFRKGDTDTTTPDTKTRLKMSWGWEANFAVRVDSESPSHRRVPGIIVAATMSLPNKEVAEEAVTLMSYAKNVGKRLTPGIADADKQYWANSLVERLHDPAFMLGFTPSTDYRVDRLLPRGGAHGARYHQGNAYCPATPDFLLQATWEYKNEKIDKATFRERQAELVDFRLHVKETKPADRAILRCPALGPSPTVTCPLRELAKNAADKTRSEVDQENLPDILDKICVQHSASFDMRELRRDAQAFEYGSDEWESFHSHARNSIESLNNQIKNGGTENIESSARRLVRGFAAAQVMMTILATNFNLGKIARFIHAAILDDARGKPWGPLTPKGRARDSKHHNPYPDTYPPGVTPPKKTKRTLGDDNGTGGPPLRT